MGMRRTLLAASACILAVAGQASAALAQADWRAEMQVLRIGYLASPDPSVDAARLEPFRAYIESRIELPVELIPSTTYDSLIDAEVTGRVQYGIHSATSFAAADAACACLEPLAVPSALDGSTGFYAILLVRAESSIQSLADARGKRLALAGEDSVAGNLVPLKAFAEEGIDVGTYFADVSTYPGPEAAIAAMLAGNADLAVGWSSLAGDPAAGYSFGVLTRMVIDGRLLVDPLRVVWQSRRIPFGPHAVRRDMPAELKTILSDALQSMVVAAPEALEAVDRSGYGGGGFVAIDPAEYAVIADLVTAPR